MNLTARKAEMIRECETMALNLGWSAEEANVLVMELEDSGTDKICRYAVWLENQFMPQED